MRNGSHKVKDKSVRYRLETRFSRIIKGNFGAGAIRVYYTIKDKQIVLLLCGGDKSSQKEDIQLAKKLLDDPDDEDLKNES